MPEDTIFAKVTMTANLVARALAFLALLLIATATLVPIDLRPHLADGRVERLAAFVLLGMLLALGFPRRLGLVLVFVVATAAVLELIQIVDPTRHAEWIDFAIKAAGGLVGAAIGAGAPRKPGRLPQGKSRP